MNNKQYNLLALGSCRVCNILYHYQNTYNTWWQRNGPLDLANSKCMVGRSWNINEQLELLKIIKGDKPFVEYVGAEFPEIEYIKDNILFLRQEFDQIDAVVVEISSLIILTTLFG